MSADGTLAYEIIADASQIKAEIKGTEAEIHKLHGELMSLAHIAFGPLVAGFAGVAAAAGAVGIGVKIAAERESVRVAFKNIIGDAKEAAKVFEELMKYSNTTPFQLDEVMHAAKTLAASGVAASDLSGEIGVLGNIAAATGGSLSELARIFGQVKGTGHLMTRELYEFVNQGAGEVKSQLAATLNVPIEKLAELGEAGNISFAMVRAALHDLGGETGKWGQATAELGQTTLGLWSTLKDAVTQVGEELGRPVNAAIKPVLKDLTELADRLTPMMADVGGSVAGMVTGIDQFLAHAGQGNGVIAELGDAMKDMWTTAGDYAGVVFSGLGVIVAGLGQALLQAVTPAGEALGHLFKAAGESIESAIHSVLAEVQNLMAGLPFQTKQQVALHKSLAKEQETKAALHSELAGEEVQAAKDTWEKGQGGAKAMDTLNKTIADSRKTMDDGFKGAEAHATGRKEARDRPKTLAAEDAEASKVNKDIAMKAAQEGEKGRHAANAQRMLKGEELIPKPDILQTPAEKLQSWKDDNRKRSKRGEALVPKPDELKTPEEKQRDWANTNKQLKAEGKPLLPPLPHTPGAPEKHNFDVTGAAHRASEADDHLFASGAPGAGLTLMQHAKEALDGGDLKKAKDLTDKAAKTKMPTGPAAAAGLENMAKQAGKQGDKDLQTKLLEMARKATEAGDKIEGAGEHASRGGDSIMHSLTSAGAKLGKAGQEVAGQFKIHGYDYKKDAAEQARGRKAAKNAWDSMDGSEKAKYGNDPSKWMHQKKAEFADQGGTQKDWDKTMRQSPWDVFGGRPQPLNPRALSPEQLNQRGNQMFQQNNGGSGAAKPQAETADSSTKTILNNIHREIASMNSHMASWDVA